MARHVRISFLLTALLLVSQSAAAASLLITTEDAPPASMLEGEQVIGRETEKVRELMARTHTDYRIDLLPWKRAFTMAQTRPNTCVYSTAHTDERDKLFKWVGPTDEADWELWGLADHKFTLNTLEDARKLRIGTYNGDARDEFLRSRGFSVEPVTNDLLNPQKLLLKRIDLWAVGHRTATPMPQYGWSDKIVPLLVFNRLKIYLACSLATPDDLIARLNAALDEMRRDGTILRIEKKWEHWSAPK
jgi:polar amino acid transport system substrate-binding protein